LPFFLFHLDHQVSRLRIEIFDAATGDSVGFADNERFVVRNSSPTAFFAFTWTGAASPKPAQAAISLPNGSYRAVLSVVKALGNAKNPAHVESWTSPTMAIARP
jgi:minor extracellular serine protease Vpr